MAITLRQKLESLPQDRQEAIKTHAQQLIAEEMSLQSLRQARQLTQVKVAELLNIRQENVSRLEKRADLLISTLREYVSAMGGSLRIVAEFPDRPAVELAGLGEAELGKNLPKQTSSLETNT